MVWPQVTAAGAAAGRPSKIPAARTAPIARRPFIVSILPPRQGAFSAPEPSGTYGGGHSFTERLCPGSSVGRLARSFRLRRDACAHGRLRDRHESGRGPGYQHGLLSGAATTVIPTLPVSRRSTRFTSTRRSEASGPTARSLMLRSL